jgi:hypothetical protein
VRTASAGSLTSSSINSAATALTASRITSACSSSNTFPDDLLDRHPVDTGHAAPPFVEP